MITAGSLRSFQKPTNQLLNIVLGNVHCKKLRTKRSTIHYAISDHRPLPGQARTLKKVYTIREHIFDNARPRIPDLNC